MQETKVLKGFCIVVLDRGFIYVGDTEYDGEWCTITNAKNIRKWGTTNGLGQLVNDGPTAETKLDVINGTVRCPARAVISLIDTEKSKWSK